MAEYPKKKLDDTEVKQMLDSMKSFDPDLDSLQYSSMAQALTHFNQLTDSHGDLISEFAVELYDNNTDEPSLDTYNLASKEAEAFGAIAAVAMSEDETTDDKLRTLSEIYIRASQERAELFSQLVQADEEYVTENLEAPGKELVEDQLAKCFADGEDTDDIILKIKDCYFQDLAVDYNQLKEYLGVDSESEVESVAETEVSSSSAREVTISIQKSTKDHLLDVAKITAGVLGALAVDRILRRPR